MPKKSSPIIRETVDGYLSRGGEITQVDPSVAGDLRRLNDADVVEMLQGATYDDAFNRNATSWYVPDDVLASIKEELGERDYDYAYED